MRLLPLFPLSLVAFPGEKLNLHIFEPRYRQLVRDCFTDRTLTFGITPYLDEAVQELGTEMRLLSVEKTHTGGEMDIRTQAVGIFRVQKFYRQAPGKLYAAGQVEAVTQDDGGRPGIARGNCQAGAPALRGAGPAQAAAGASPDFQIFDVAHHIGLSTEQEYQLLGTTAEQERQELVREHLERLLPAVLETERLKERVRQNGHLKHLQPLQF
ncbi:MAG: LON peptidase substrate-binding domain-containing protein [Hymenobacter sp.]